MKRKSCGCPQIPDPQRAQRIEDHLRKVLLILDTAMSKGHKERNQKVIEDNLESWVAQTRVICAEN